MRPSSTAVRFATGVYTLACYRHETRLISTAWGPYVALNNPSRPADNVYQVRTNHSLMGRNRKIGGSVSTQSASNIIDTGSQYPYSMEMAHSLGTTFMASSELLQLCQLQIPCATTTRTSHTTYLVSCWQLWTMEKGDIALIYVKDKRLALEVKMCHLSTTGRQNRLALP